MVAKILDDNNEELKQGPRRKQRERQKSDRSGKTTTLHLYQAFFLLHFLAVVARLRNGTS